MCWSNAEVSGSEGVREVLQQPAAAHEGRQLALRACCKSVNCGVKGHSAHRYGPKMRCCARWRPDFCHFEGFRLPIRWISRAVGLLQQALTASTRGSRQSAPCRSSPSLPATWKQSSTCSACPGRLVANHLKKLSTVSILRSSPARSSRLPASS